MEKTPHREALTNTGALNTAIADAFSKRLNIEREIEAKVEEHVTPLKDSRAKLWRDLKADTTIAQADLQAVYKLWRRQQDARLLDADAGEKVIDSMRTLFLALQVGEMLDFIDVLEGADHQPAHLREADTARLAAAAEDENSPFLVP
jgi:ATP-dependent exoDNAse (exonuclease V) beta subunit